MDQSGHVENLEVSVPSFRGHGKHEPSLVERVCNEPSRAAVQAKGIEDGEQPSKHNLESADGGMDLGHDKDESLGRRRRLRVDGDGPLDFDERGLIDERLRLGIDGVGGVGIGNGRDRLDFFRLLRVVELDVALEQGQLAVVGRLFLGLLLLLKGLFVGR